MYHQAKITKSAPKKWARLILAVTIQVAVLLAVLWMGFALYDAVMPRKSGSPIDWPSRIIGAGIGVIIWKGLEAIADKAKCAKLGRE